MKSDALPSFWEGFRKLTPAQRQQARKSYRLWMGNPFHPSLRFKCINVEENIWSARISQSHRALGVWESDTVTWFWIGSHNDYEHHYG
jgi:hypothetical protein